ncbi:epidermal growth factor receptor-like [Glandiceps talaboti]
MYGMAPWTMANVWLFISAVGYLLGDHLSSANSCSDGTFLNENGECEACNGPCPIICPGFGTDNVGGYDHLNEENIEIFNNNCTIINGSMVLTTTTYDGDPLKGLIGVKPNELDIFHSVKGIMGYLRVVHSGNTQYELSAFKNLETISGRELYQGKRSLIIQSTTLKSLGLTSLKMISHGNVWIKENPLLCYISKSMFDGILKNTTVQRASVGSNRRKDICVNEGAVCDRQCSNGECWGHGPDQCLSCVHFEREDSCVQNCEPNDGYYQMSSKKCASCDDECLNSCSGPGPYNCTACKHVQDGDLCKSECPAIKYLDEENRCQNCHDNCKTSGENIGCTGPESIMGPNGCNSCDKVLQDNQRFQCIQPGMLCPENYFELSGNDGMQMCQKCHSECLGCTGPDADNCVDCKNVKLGNRCVAKCPGNYSADDANICRMCNNECQSGCYGSDATQCSECKNYKISMKDQGLNDTFHCVSECPLDKPYIMDDKECVSNCSGNTFADSSNYCQPCHKECLYGCKDERSSTCHTCKNFKSGNGYCVPNCNLNIEKEEDGLCQPIWDKKPGGVDSTPIIIGSIVATLPVIAIIVLLVWYVRRQREMDEKRERYLQVGTADMPMDTFAEAENIEPSGALPNKAHLRIISESELQKGGILGAGAFGTVYKGLWLPEGDKVRIPVAIKVLHEGNMTSKANQELLEEAYLMASTNHENVVRLLCLSMSHQMMLITQLLPLGALIDYLRKHKHIIGSQHILNWSVQIAKGMYYLETKRLVHRDLAARNVLVETPSRVKITDFGLAKFIDVNQDEYTAGGGKMPIKWLALECITHRRFTHQSDVWSYGVTLWEIMTFGGKPYEGVKPRDIPDLLEKGERLRQPDICTIEVYMIMLKCWMLDEDSRPTFKELVEEFMNMARDPHRFLVIENDVSAPIESPSRSEFYRNLLPDESPELLMDADEYLLPASTLSISENENENENENGSVVHDYDSPVST